MNKIQETLIKGLKEYFNNDLVVPEFKSEEDARNFIQKYTDKFVLIYDGLYIDYKTKININEEFLDEFLDETPLSIELGISCICDIWDDMFSERDFYRVNNLEIPEELKQKWEEADKKFQEYIEEELRLEEELERKAMELLDQDNPYDYYSPGDDFEEDWIRSLE